MPHRLDSLPPSPLPTLLENVTSYGELHIGVISQLGRRGHLEPHSEVPLFLEYGTNTCHDIKIRGWSLRMIIHPLRDIFIWIRVCSSASLLYLGMAIFVPIASPLFAPAMIVYGIRRPYRVGPQTSTWYAHGNNLAIINYMNCRLVFMWISRKGYNNWLKFLIT